MLVVVIVAITFIQLLRTQALQRRTPFALLLQPNPNDPTLTHNHTAMQVKNITKSKKQLVIIIIKKLHLFFIQMEDKISIE